jgi:hypothetical protein
VQSETVTENGTVTKKTNIATIDEPENKSPYVGK